MKSPGGLLMNSRLILSLLIILIIAAPSLAIFGIAENSQPSQSDQTRALADSPWPMFRGNVQHTGVSPYDTSENPGVLRWRYKTGDEITTSPAIDNDGTIYFGSRDSDIYALYPNGTLKWRYNTGGEIRSSPAIGSDGSIYIGSYDKHLYCLKSDGILKWKFNTVGEVSSSPVIDKDGIIYIACQYGYIYAIYSDGTQKWKVQFSGWAISSSPALCSDGKIYIGSMDNNLYSINSDGTLYWEYKTGDWVESSPSIGVDGTIYVNSLDYYFYAINPNGTLRWKYHKGSGSDSSPAIGPDGTIYFGTPNDKIISLNSNGSLKWKFNVVGKVDSSPSISSDGTIFVGASNGYLYAIKQDGSQLWNFRTGMRISSSPSIGDDGTIYVGSEDNYLYAINVGPPYSPKDLQVTSGNNYANLSWQEPDYDGGSEIYGYKIYKGQESGKEEYLKIINTTSLSFIDDDVLNGETYYYYITAINEVGESKYSNEVNATPLGPPTKPIDLVALINEGKIELNWIVPENDGGTEIERYNIYRGPNQENTTFLSFVAPPTTTFQDLTANEKSTYFYYVTALNFIAESDSSNNVTITLVIYPSPPMDLKVTAGDSNVILQWEAPVEDGGSKIIKYHILRRPVDGRGKLIQSVDESITSYQDAAVVNGKTYIYYVTAENSLGESDPSQEVTAKPVKSRDQEDEIMVSFEINIFILIIIVIIVIVAILLFFKKRKAKKRDHKSFFEDPKTPDSQYPDEPQPPLNQQYPPRYPPQQPPQYPPKEYY